MNLTQEIKQEIQDNFAPNGKILSESEIYEIFNSLADFAFHIIKYSKINKNNYETNNSIRSTN